MSLIERLEKATEGSRELDRLIADAVRTTKYPKSMFAEYPHYTTSVDAALTLVPEGSVWHVMTDYGDLNRAKVGPRGRPSASIYNSDERELFVQADAETPALALCIAVLKGREQAREAVG